MSHSKENFQQFIQSLLRLGGLNEKRVNEFTNRESLLIFQQALTHKSFHAQNNYEYLEFFGDSMVNSAVSLYLRDRFPKVVSIKWLVKMQHNLSSKTFLAELSNELGFLKYARYGPSINDIINSGKDLMCDIDYLSMMEDFFEAFFAAVYMVIDDRTTFGVGDAIANNIIFTILDRKNIQLDYHQVFDPRSRLKEIYDSRQIDFDQHNKTYPKEISKDGWYTSQVWWTREDGRVTHFKSAKECTKTGARNQAAFNALEALKRMGITDKDLIQNPRQYIPKDVETVGERNLNREKYVRNNIHLLITALLVRGKVNSESIPLFVNKQTIPLYVEAFTDRSYPLSNDSTLYKMTGDPLSIFCVLNFIRQRFPDVRTEKWLTRMRHKLMSKTVLGVITHQFGFGDFVLYGKSVQETIDRIPNLDDNEEYMNVMKSIFTSFIGVLVHVIDSVRGGGVGIHIAMNIISSFLNLVPISLEYTNIFDPISRLKEVYDIRRWRFDQNIEHSEFSTEEGIKEHTYKIYGTPQGQKVLLGQATARTKKKAKNIASEKALTLLSRVYKINEILPSWK